MKKYYVYIVASISWVLYTWVTNNLKRRIHEHKNWLSEWFTKKYKCKKLLYYEESNDINLMINREKQIKKWNRNKKINLIKWVNNNLDDLSLNL